MTAAAGTELADPYSLVTVKFFANKSSKESSTMGESLMEQRRVQDEGFRVVNCFYE